MSPDHTGFDLCFIESGMVKPLQASPVHMKDCLKEEPILVVFCSDNNYVMQLGVSIRSLVLNHLIETPLEIFILSDAISPENRQKLFDCTKGHANVSLKWVELDAKLLTGLRPTRKVTRTTFARLFIPQILPPGRKKAIYLDADILVLSEIEELWHQNVSSYSILAAKDYENLVSSPGIFPNYKILGIPENNRNFNSGVLVINLERWRREGITQLCLEYLKKFDATRVLNDQEALNAVLFKSWALLDWQWNRMEPTSESVFPGVLRRWKRRLLGEKPGIKSGIIHYCGMRKPWQPGYLGEGRKGFYQYLDQTPWEGWRASRIAGLWAVCRHDLLRAAKLVLGRIRKLVKDLWRMKTR